MTPLISIGCHIAPAPGASAAHSRTHGFAKIMSSVSELYYYLPNDKEMPPQHRALLTAVRDIAAGATNFRAKLDFISKLRFRMYDKKGRLMPVGTAATVASLAKHAYKGLARLPPSALLDFDAALKDAQKLGYAEADESLDVDGWDTAHKASVLAWLAHGMWVKPDRMIVEGISRITPADFKTASTLGYGIKLLAVITRDFATNELSVRVQPTLLPEGNVLANVSGVFNAISVTGDVVGTTLYIGRGAGQDATASAVISDIADAVALLRHGKGAHHMGDDAPAPCVDCRLAPLLLRCRSTGRIVRQ